MNFLVNAYFSKNVGDDLFLKVLFERYPESNWYLLTSNPNYGNVFSHYKNVHILKSLSYNLLGLRRIDLFTKVNDYFLNYQLYDGLIIIGGSIFMEGPEWKNGLENRSILPQRFNELNKKTFIIGSNFGPFTDSKFADKHKEFFSLFEDICFRDQYSYELFKDLSNVRLAPDVVFNLKVEKPVKREKSVGFSMINLKNRNELKDYFQAYNYKMIDLINHYISLDYNIKLFSFCEKEGDLTISNYIKNQIKEKHRDNIEIIDYNGDLESFLLKFQACELIIGTRFHSIILALVFGQQLLPIIYSDKTYYVLKDMGLDKIGYFIKDIENLKPKVINLNISDLNLREVRSEAGKQFKELDLFINNRMSIATI